MRTKVSYLPQTDVHRQTLIPNGILLTEQSAKSPDLSPDLCGLTCPQWHGLSRQSANDRLDRMILTQRVKVSVVADAVVAGVSKQTKQLCCLSMSA